MHIPSQGPHSPQAPFSQTPSDTSSPAQQRQAVKKIATSLQSELATYESIPMVTTNVEKLDALRNRLIEKNQQLATLNSAGLDATPPAPSFGRRFKSGLALSGGAFTRTGAAAAATATGAAQSAALAVAMPVFGVVSGASNGFVKGFNAPVACAKPVTAAIGLGLGAAGGAVSGTVGTFVAIPAAIGVKGSIPRKTFNLIDQLPRARAYANRKKQSTREISHAANNTINTLLNKVEEKQEQAQFFATAPGLLREAFQDMHQTMGQAMQQALRDEQMRNH